MGRQTYDQTDIPTRQKEERERERERLRGRERETETERKRDRQTDRGDRGERDIGGD